MSDPGTFLIQAAATALAAGLISPEEIMAGRHGFSAERIDLAVDLATKRPADALVIHPGYRGEGLALQIDALSIALGMNFATAERIKDHCLAERDDADDLLAVIVAASAKHRPTDQRPPTKPIALPGDDGGVLPDPRFTRTPTSPPATSAPTYRASPACMRGKHSYGAPDRHGWATCTDCGVTIVCAEPGTITYREGGDFIPVV